MLQNEINAIVSNIIDSTSDGKKLSYRHLKLVESAVNGFIDEEGITELNRINEMVKNGNYVNWFHGIENMTINHQGYIQWKGIVVGEYNFNSVEEENAKVKEIHSRCLHIKSLGLIPTTRNCDFYWKHYENLKPDSIDNAYPWVIDYYYTSEDKWKEIDEHHYNWYFECLPPITMNSNGFLSGEPYTHTSEGEGVYLACKCQNGKYYAQLLTLKEYKSKIHQPINEDQCL